MNETRMSIRHKFKRGDKVFLVKRGQIEWETADWTMTNARIPRLVKNMVYTVEGAQYYNSEYYKPCIRVNGYLYHEDHFKEYEPQI